MTDSQTPMRTYYRNFDRLVGSKLCVGTSQIANAFDIVLPFVESRHRQVPAHGPIGENVNALYRAWNPSIRFLVNDAQSQAAGLIEDGRFEIQPRTFVNVPIQRPSYMNRWIIYKNKEIMTSL